MLHIESLNSGKPNIVPSSPVDLLAPFFFFIKPGLLAMWGLAERTGKFGKFAIHAIDTFVHDVLADSIAQINSPSSYFASIMQALNNVSVFAFNAGPLHEK